MASNGDGQILNHVLRIVAPDQQGLIYKISGVIVKHNLNIVKNDEFVSPGRWAFAVS